MQTYITYIFCEFKNIAVFWKSLRLQDTAQASYWDCPTKMSTKMTFGYSIWRRRIHTVCDIPDFIDWKTHFIRGLILPNNVSDLGCKPNRPESVFWFTPQSHPSCCFWLCRKRKFSWTFLEKLKKKSGMKIFGRK